MVTYVCSRFLNDSYHRFFLKFSSQNFGRKTKKKFGGIANHFYLCTPEKNENSSLVYH